MYPQLYFNVVLVEPEIPQNTGTIGRTCVGAWSKLHLIEPLGFDISDRSLKRAGLDYWPELDWHLYPNFQTWNQIPKDHQRVFYFTTKTQNSFYDVQYQMGDYFVFGKETKGLGPEILSKAGSQAVTIPFPGKIRSFNLSNAVSMVLGEGLRQLRYNKSR